ncbi:hypothetical protein EUTSA_v10023912mg [Eutrema salsugineum]|uniref:Uncharacterized protein n=1 Tax=Eutrema salsugineum TaxID=72664 RepID=V4KH40_EUTSA|nr:hypothetical protein EUTSA_v10023912mg [Eutrema salsugineum]
MVLVYDDPTDLITFVSSGVPMRFTRFHIALVRSFTALSMIFNVFYPNLGNVFLVLLSSWPYKRKLMFSLVKMVMEYPVASFMEQSLFPIVPPIGSGLDFQASSVLQGSSSRLMVFSAFVAVFVAFQVTLDVTVQEDYKIVVRLIVVFWYDLYPSISRFINPLSCSASFGRFVSTLSGVELC